MSLPSSIDPSDVARITRAQYDAMVASGALDDANVELFEGVIVEMSPRGTEHAGAIQVLSDVLRHALGARAWVREGGRYARTTLARRGDVIVLSAFPDVSIAVDLFVR